MNNQNRAETGEILDRENDAAQTRDEQRVWGEAGDMTARVHRLRKLKALIDGGEYHVSSALIADSLVRRMRNTS